MRAGPGREDIENDLGSIHDPHPELGFEVLALSRTQFLVEHHQVRTRLLNQFTEFTGLSFSQEESRVRSRQPLDQRAYDFAAGEWAAGPFSLWNWGVFLAGFGGGAALYIGGAWVLGVEELTRFVELVRRKLGR